MKSNLRRARADTAINRDTAPLASPFTVATHETVRTKARTVATAIRAYIEEGIATGAMPPGMKLPTEHELMASYRAGRNTIRKVMHALEAEGKIVRQVGSGTFVAEPPAAAGSPEQGLIEEIARSVARLASPSDVMELRLAFEPALMPIVALRASLEEIEAMERFVALSAQARSPAEFEKLDCELHKAIGRATKNIMFVKVYDMITTARERAAWGRLKERALTPDQRHKHTREHERIVAAIRERDGTRARAEMKRHLEEISKSMFGSAQLA